MAESISPADKCYHDLSDADCAAVGPNFSRMFPGILLRDFRYFAKSQGRLKVILDYEGHESDLLHFELVYPDMLAPLPKRLAYSFSPEDKSWDFQTRRLARGRVSVRIWSYSEMPKTLASFGADCWPWFATEAEHRAHCEESFASAANAILSLVRVAVTSCESACLAPYGYKLKPEDRELLIASASLYGAELQDLTLRARIVSATRPELRIVS